MKRLSSASSSPVVSEQTWLYEGNAPGVFRTHRMSVENMEVVVVEGPHKGESVRFEEERIFIGREPWCDLSLSEDRRLSRNHCELRVSPFGVEVRDLGSRNGVFIEGAKVFHGLWSPGQTLQVGDSILSLGAIAGQNSLQVQCFESSGRLVGESQAMRSIFSMLSRLRSTEVPVLLKGETGTGKTSVAQVLHEESPYAEGPFVQVNCGAIAPSLMESELFGYEKGAFTGAHKERKGILEQANGGTLFLDEIGELPLDMQPKLLDVLERKKVRRLGSEKERDVSFRLISATHRDLDHSIQHRQFREDLFYRISVVELSLPSLKERVEDLSLLAMHFLMQIAPERKLRCTPAFFYALERYPWPGNVRQLRNVLQRCLVFAENDVLDVGDLPASLSEPVESSIKAEPHKHLPEEELTKESFSPDVLQIPPAQLEDGTVVSLSERMAELERQIVVSTLERNYWQATLASKELGVSKGWLYRLMKKYEIKKPW